jgi:hypothetical protein
MDHAPKRCPHRTNDKKDCWSQRIHEVLI